MGIFGGVVTAIVAGGDTDTILRAGARFIDPDASRPVAAAVIAPRAIEPAFKAAPLEPSSAPLAAQEKASLEKTQEKSTASIVKPIVGEPVHIKPEPKVAARAEAKPEAKESKPEPKFEVKVAAKAEPKPERQAPVAWTTPVRRAEPKPVPSRAEKTEKVAEKADKPEEDLPLTGTKKRRDELASAAAANALAKAQLEGSL